MRRFILDSGIASDCINRRYRVFEHARESVAGGARIGVGTPVLGELLSGIESSASRDRNLERFQRAVSTWIVWPYDRDAAEEFGRISALLRRLERPMQAVDIQIAAIAQSLGNSTVVTRDGDFRIIPGLSIENWAE